MWLSALWAGSSINMSANRNIYLLAAVLVPTVVAVILFFVFKEKIMAIISPPKLSTAQQDAVNELHPAVRDRFARLIGDIESKTDWKVTVTSAYRSYAEQAALKAQNASNASAGNSYHNFGMALDINLTKDKTTLRKASSKSDWEKSGVPQIARAAGFRWGGDFSNYHDPIHFDLGNKYSIEKLKQLAVAQFGSNPANVKGNQIKIS